MESKLFRGISEEDLKIFLDDVGAKEITARKNQVIVHQGETVKNIYVCLEGAFNVESVNFRGETSLISHVSKGGYFGGRFCLFFTPVPR